MKGFSEQIAGGIRIVVVVSNAEDTVTIFSSGLAAFGLSYVLEILLDSPSVAVSSVAIEACCSTLFRVVRRLRKSKSILAMPLACGICNIDGVTLEVRAPLSINFYLHLQNQVSTVGVVSFKLSDVLTRERIGVFSALKCGILLMKDKRSIP